MLLPTKIADALIYFRWGVEHDRLSGRQLAQSQRSFGVSKKLTSQNTKSFKNIPCAVWSRVCPSARVTAPMAFGGS